MNTNITELNMEGLEPVNGGWELWNYIMVQLNHSARDVAMVYAAMTTKKDQKDNPKKISPRGR